MCDFSQLHCHTSYSLLDGAARIKTLLDRAAEMELTAVGITDHGNLFGVPEFYTAARRVGVLPVVGSEFYLCADMQDRSNRTRYHQVLWAKNEQGYRNLMRLSSLSYTDGHYYKPRIDRAALRRYGEDLVATTCCLQGEVPQTLLKKGEEAARAVFEAYLDLFGADYYIELQDHGIADQHRCNAVLLRWAKEYNVKVVATNDVHYVDQADAAAQDVLLCLQTGKDLTDPNRMRFENDQFYLKSGAEMKTALAAWDDDGLVEQALATASEIADACQFELSMGTLLMPHFPIPAAFENDMDAYLRHLVYQGARRRYGELSQDVTERLDRELAIIKTMGYAGYFLIVQDFTSAARDLGVSVGPGRGSAAGSAVAYCLGITNIDPLAYDLLFERFLNPERVSMPDIDIDFDDRGRSLVIDYVVQKYGRENVCQIITFGTMGARSVIRDVARVLGLPLAEADRIAKLIPEGPKVSLQSALNHVPALRALQKDPNAQIRKLMHYAEVLEGSARHTGVHAAGVIIAPGKVSDYVPVAIAKSKGDHVVTTQYDGTWVESFGLLKMDFLGLSTLTVLNDALALIRANHGVEIDLDAIPLDDEKTYALFQRGETVAIFQFESENMREWMRKLKPTCLDDLIAMNALYRPGPMDLIPNYIDRKHGREKVEYPHPMLEPVLKPTYGIPVYQEQVMQMAQVMGGYSLGGADLLRRAMGKKKQSEMDKQRVIFVEGARERDVDEKTAHEVFDMMAKFAGYGFNKCVTGDTEIIDAATGRRIRILDIVEGRERDVCVVSLDEDRLKLVARRVVDAFPSGRATTYRLTTRTGRTLRATGNHPVYTQEGWKNLGDLSPSDRVAVPRFLPYTASARMEPHELVVLGYALAEGNLCHPSGFYVYTGCPEELADYVLHLKQFANTAATIDRSKPAVSVYARRRDRTRPAGAVAFIERLGLRGKKARTNRIPDQIFRLALDQLALLLGRMWTGDGCVHARGLYYATSSRHLAHDVQHLLLRLGIPSTIYSKRFRYRGGLKRGYAVRVSDKEVDRFAWVIGPHLVGKRRRDLDAVRATRMGNGRMTQDVVPASIFPSMKAAVRREAERQGVPMKADMRDAEASYRLLTLDPRKKGYDRQTLAKIADAVDSDELLRWARSDVYWDEIGSLEEAGVEDVYDLTVEGTHNFVANDLIVHNSHSAAYSVVAYQTAYLKANYPAEFMAAAMTNEMGDTKKLAVVIDEARRLGLELLPPSINHSEAAFTVEGGAIRFGLGAVKGVGLGAIEALLQARAEKGPFHSLFGMAPELDLRAVNKKALECLARVGALDDLEGHRAQLVEATDAAVQYAQKVQADKAAGQSSLFGAAGTTGPALEPNLPITDPWPKARLLKEERELTGVYVSGHPLDAYRPEADAFASARLGDTDAFADDSEAAPNAGGDGYGGPREKPQHTFCGIITEVQRRSTRTGKPIAFATLEDFTGQGELVCFARTLDKVQNYLKVDEIVLVRGEVELRGGSVKILTRTVTPMWKVREQMVKALILRIAPGRVSLDVLDQFRALCDANRGHCRLYFDVLDPALPGGKQRVRSRTHVLDLTPELMHGITRLFGRDNVVLEGES